MDGSCTDVIHEPDTFAVRYMYIVKSTGYTEGIAGMTG